MKKILITLCILFMGLKCFADVMEIETIGSMKTFWDRTGKYEQKILEVGTKLINDNKLDKRIAFQTIRTNNIINACATRADKTVHVYYGIIPYIDNDDELAYLLGHEMAHAIDAYGGFFKWIDMSLNGKAYEFKADLRGIDIMVKAGYNPVAAICMINKWMPETYWDFGVLTTHPKTSRRMMEMYKYIYRKYPWALQTDMVHNINYENFTYSSQKEINLFLQREKEREFTQGRGSI